MAAMKSVNFQPYHHWQISLPVIGLVNEMLLQNLLFNKSKKESELYKERGYRLIRKETWLRGTFLREGKKDLWRESSVLFDTSCDHFIYSFKVSERRAHGTYNMRQANCIVCYLKESWHTFTLSFFFPLMS
jgi:hypothetical protein